MIYARVSCDEHKECLERHVELLAQLVKEIASGVNAGHPKLLALLKDQRANRIVVEHKDCLTRFGFRYLETLLEIQGRSIEVENASRQR